MKETRKRWNYICLRFCCGSRPKLQGIGVFELHEKHGLHVHLLTNRFIDVNAARMISEKAGWGRIHVMRMPAEHAGYVGKYLSKEHHKVLKRWRLWAAFGKGWEPTKVKDVLKNTRCLAEYLRPAKSGRAGKGAAVVTSGWISLRQMLFLTIEKEWKPGLGPNDKPYWMCSRRGVVSWL